MILISGSPLFGLAFMMAPGPAARQSICALGFHRQHRARRMAHDFLRNIADDQSLDAGSAMGRQDNELGAEVFTGIEDRFKRIALTNVVANFRPFQDVVMAKLFE